MSRKGRSPDNARAEGFFGLVKSEFLRCRDWAGTAVGEFMAELDARLSWFRSGRRRETLGWMTPGEYRASQGHALG